MVVLIAFAFVACHKPHVLRAYAQMHLTRCQMFLATVTFGRMVATLSGGNSVAACYSVAMPEAAV